MRIHLLNTVTVKLEVQKEVRILVYRTRNTAPLLFIKSSHQLIKTCTMSRAYERARNLHEILQLVKHPRKITPGRLAVARRTQYHQLNYVILTT